MLIQEEKVEIIEDKNKFKKVNMADNNDFYLDNKKHTFIYIASFFAILFILLLIIFVIFTIYNINHNDKISQNVYICGIDVSGLSKTEAKEKLSSEFEKIQSSDIHLVTSDSTYETYINPTEIDLNFDIDSAINYAFNVGKSGNIFTDDYDVFDTLINGINITPTYTLNEDSLKTFLNNISNDLPNAVVESSYYIEDSNLILTKGSSGYIVNVDQTQSNIYSSLLSLDFLSNSVELILSPQDPKELNLDDIYNEIYKEAVDAYYTTDPYAVYPSSTGIDFKISLSEAKQLLDESDNECTIPLKTLYPEVTTNMIGLEAFPNLLATFSTKYSSSDSNRTTNLKLAANKINGTVLLPGETFSYNTVVGERTIAAGYKEASMYENGQVVNGVGGGICQVSTTLFNATLLANLNIVEIHNHQFVPSYTSAGRDATVSYGTKDFQFSNSRNYAIKIECTVSNGIVKVNLYGVKESNEYDVSISAKITSQTSSYIKASTSRILKQNGKIVSTEHIYNSTYKAHY